MRLAVLHCVHETNSFSPVATTLDDFFLYDFAGGDLSPEDAMGRGSEIGGFVTEARQQNLEFVPLLGARARSGGNMTAGVVMQLRERVLAALRRAGPVDGVYLALHGATVGDGHPDVTGEILADARQVFGRRLPLVCSVDFHANVTPAMTRNCDALIIYRTFPHVDCADVGRRSLLLLASMVRDGKQLSNVLVRLPMILPAEATATIFEPMASLITRLSVLNQRPGIATASLSCVQPWLDVEDLGCSVVVVADGNPAAVQREALALARDYWESRRSFHVDLVPPAEAVRQAAALPGPVVLSDSADATTSGSTGDSTAILEELLKQNAPGPCLLTVTDAAAALQARRAGVGATLAVTIGGACDPARFRSLALCATVESLSDGEFVGTSPMGRGSRFHMGPTAVLRVGEVYIVATSRAEANFGPELFRSLGLEPASARIVVVKSPAGFRANYAGIAKQVMIVDGPGSTPAHLASIPFTRLRRPLYPLDEFEHEATIST